MAQPDGILGFFYIFGEFRFLIFNVAHFSALPDFTLAA